MKKKNVVWILIGCALFAIMAAFIASSHPDGLEWVAEKAGFIHFGEGKEVFTSPMPDYLMPCIKNEFLSSVVAAIGGTLLMFGVVWGIGRLLQRK